MYKQKNFQTAQKGVVDEKQKETQCDSESVNC